MKNNLVNKSGAVSAEKDYTVPYAECGAVLCAHCDSSALDVDRPEADSSEMACRTCGGAINPAAHAAAVAEARRFSVDDAVAEWLGIKNGLLLP